MRVGLGATKTDGTCRQRASGKEAERHCLQSKPHYSDGKQVKDQPAFYETLGVLTLANMALEQGRSSLEQVRVTSANSYSKTKIDSTV